MITIETTKNKSSIFYDVGKCKELIIEMVLNNNDICELLTDHCMDELTDEDIDNLINTQVFPYLYTDETQTDELTYLCFEINPVPEYNSHTVKDMVITVWAYCHKRIMSYFQKGYSGTRVDILIDMFERTMRDTYDLGIGKLEYNNTQQIFPNNKYYGRAVTFTVPDFKIKKKSNEE